MQVNVKELTGVLHLNFMNVLVLQSFLAVSLVECYHLSSASVPPLSSYSSI